MNNKIKSGFLILVIVQALHSIEEYIGKLWEVFPPAKYLTLLFSDNHETGFLITNIGFFVLGILVWFFLVQRNHPIANGLIWLWIILELINGFGHSAWSLIQKNYTPGLITAPFMIVIAFYLARATTYSKKTLH